LSPRRGTGPGVALGEWGGGAEVLRFSHQAMATLFEVHCVHDDPGYAGQAARDAFDLVDRLEGELSRFLANSDVSRVNNLSVGRQTRVSPTTMECLQVAWHLHELTAGAFDVSLGTGLEGLELDPKGLTVRAHVGGVRLDLGGVGKGYAIDQVAELLEDWEIGRALVHGGFSSVLALEATPGQEGWPLSLSAPGPEARVLARITARQQALGASGLLKGDHIQDPRSGRAVEDRQAAWVVVPREEGGLAGALADGLSTAFMILEEKEIRRMCESFGLGAWLVPRHGGESIVTLGTVDHGARRPDTPNSR
jgi:thiamine biosynthesis lipoprotein